MMLKREKENEENEWEREALIWQTSKSAEFIADTSNLVIASISSWQLTQKLYNLHLHFCGVEIFTLFIASNWTKTQRSAHDTKLNSLFQCSGGKFALLSYKAINKSTVYLPSSSITLPSKPNNLKWLLQRERFLFKVFFFNFSASSSHR